MNNSLAQLGAQLLAIWKQIGINQRISIVLAAVVVIAGLGGLMFWSGRPDYALLYGRLDDAEAAKVVAALDDAKVPYTISRGGGSISVPADKVALMRMQLASKGIPRGDGVGFEIFDKPNFGISDFVQHANYLRAVQGELARTIGQVEPVESARVMIVMPENRLLTDNLKRPTASVFVKVRGNTPLPPQTVNAIRFLVANAVEGLQSNYVTVVDNMGNVLSENTEGDSLVGLSTTQLAARKNIELYLSKKAEGMLDKVLGMGQAVVRVSADINFDTLSRTEEKYDPEGQVMRSSTINDENVDSLNATATAGGTPGVQANATTETNAPASTPVNNSHTKKKVVTSQYEINKSSSSLVQAAGGLKRISAAVFVASKLEGVGKDRKVAPRSKEELEKLKRIVQSALGIQEGADGQRKDEITLEEMTFNDQPAVEMTQQLEKQEKQQFWWDLARNAVYPVAALAVLVFFWRSFKKTPNENIPIGIPLGDFAGENGNGHAHGHANGNGNGNGHIFPGRSKNPAPSVVTVEVLNQLIRENPNNMTQAIRTWMTRSTKAK